MGACCSDESKFDADIITDGEKPQEIIASKATSNGETSHRDATSSGTEESTSDHREEDNHQKGNTDGVSDDNSSTKSTEQKALEQQLSKKQTRATLPPPLLGDGNYLIYSGSNDGSFLSIWSKEPVQNAFAFARAKEGVRIPPFKYKGKTEISRGIHSSKKGICDAFLQYLRSLKPFQCDLTLLATNSDELSKVPQVILLMHKDDNSLLLLEPNMPPIDLNKVDFAAAILVNTTGEKDIRDFASQGVADIKKFQARCKQNMDHIEVMHLGAREP